MSDEWFDWYVTRLGKEQEWAMYRGRYLCPCCYMPSLSERGEFEICRICWWEDDGQDSDDAGIVRGGPNHDYSLAEARQNFLNYKTMYRPSDEKSFKRRKSAFPKDLYEAYLKAIDTGEESDWEDVLGLENIRYSLSFEIWRMECRQQIQDELTALEGRWLIREKAEAIFDKVTELGYPEKDRKSINEDQVMRYEVLDIGNDDERARGWLGQKLGTDGLAYVVIDYFMVCEIALSRFLDLSIEVFYQSEDDILILHESGKRIACYRLEDVLQFGICGEGFGI